MSTETTGAVERAAEAIVTEEGIVDWGVLPERLREHPRGLARAGLNAALPTECHEEVQGWTEDASHPCNEPAVAFREDKWEGGAPPYPVCAKHATPDLVPLRAAILGGAS